VAWDAEQMNLRLIWHGAFMDASRHWNGRGQGSQPPLGDHVMELVSGQPLATLPDIKQPWPTEASREAGFKFLGYRLNKAGQPTFRYTWQSVEVSDLAQPVVVEKRDASIRRTVTLQADKPVSHLMFRVAAGKSLEKVGDHWLLNGAIQLKFKDVEPQHRVTGQTQELLISVDLSSGQQVISYEMIW